MKTEGRVFEHISTGSDHCFALTKEGELFSWGLNFKGQLGLGDYENRHEPHLVESMIPGGEANKNMMVQKLLKQRQENQELSQTMNLSHQRNPKGSEGGNGASKSIFNQNYKELKPSKSVDFSAFNAQGHDEEGTMVNAVDFLAPQLMEKEIVVKVACGSIHTLLLTSQHRLFSCGNGSSFALGHRNKENQSTFKQIEYFGKEELQPVRAISAGMGHSGCVTEHGDVYLWGVHIDMQLL